MTPHTSEASAKAGPDVLLGGEHLDSTPPPPPAQRSWSDEITVHPAADLFPMMSDPELRELADDIKAHGLQEPLVLWQDNRAEARGKDGPFTTYLLDGRNRLAALKMLGFDHPARAKSGQGGQRGKIRVLSAVKQVFGISFGKKAGMSKGRWVVDTDPASFVLSMNAHRRHLTQEQKRGLVAELLKAQPEKSNRQIAKQAKVDHKTVGAVREEQQARGEIPHVETRIDTLGRRQPAKPKSSLPRPTEARKIARETGCFALASDGNIYSGATEEEGKAYADKRNVGFGILDAIETLAKSPPGGEWIATAERHWFVDFRRGSIVDARNRLDEIERALDAANLGQGEAA